MARAVIILIVMSVAMFVAVSMLPGCAQAPHTAADVQPVYGPIPGTARSLTFDGTAPNPATATATEPAWYHDRTDRSRAVIAGRSHPEHRAATTRTWDRQNGHSAGQLHDHYTQTTLRIRIRGGLEH